MSILSAIGSFLGSPSGQGMMSVGSSLLNYMASRKNTRDSIQASKDLLHEENDWNIQQWERNNAYNTPSQQLALARAAGINPNAYISGASPSSNATQLQSASAPSMPVANPPGNIIGDALNAAFVSEQVKGQSIENRYRPEQLSLAIKQASEQISLTNSQKRLSNQQAVMIQRQIDVLNDKTPAEVKLINAQAQQAADQIRLLREQRKSVHLQNIVSQVESNLASQYGIVCTRDGLTALITGLADSRSSEYITTAISNLISAGTTGTFNGLWETAKNIVNPLRKKVGKKPLPTRKRQK